MPALEEQKLQLYQSLEMFCSKVGGSITDEEASVVFNNVSPALTPVLNTFKLSVEAFVEAYTQQKNADLDFSLLSKNVEDIRIPLYETLNNYFYVTMNRALYGNAEKDGFVQGVNSILEALSGLKWHTTQTVSRDIGTLPEINVSAIELLLVQMMPGVKAVLCDGSEQDTSKNIENIENNNWELLKGLLQDSACINFVETFFKAVIEPQSEYEWDIDDNLLNKIYRAELFLLEETTGCLPQAGTSYAEQLGRQIQQKMGIKMLNRSRRGADEKLVIEMFKGVSARLGFDVLEPELPAVKREQGAVAPLLG